MFQKALTHRDFGKKLSYPLPWTFIRVHLFCPAKPWPRTDTLGLKKISIFEEILQHERQNFYSFFECF
jgi:hypothetical protein